MYQQGQCYKSCCYRATDEDSPDASIVYTLEQPYSSIGQLVLHQNQPEDLRGWSKVGHLWEKRVTRWTQTDVDSGEQYNQYVSSVRVYSSFSIG